MVCAVSSQGECECMVWLGTSQCVVFEEKERKREERRGKKLKELKKNVVYFGFSISGVLSIKFHFHLTIFLPPFAILYLPTHTDLSLYYLIS